MKRYSRVPTQNGEIAAVQDQIEMAFGEMDRQIPFLDGARMTSVVIAGSSTRVAHGLGRVPLGFLILKRNANQNVWEASAADSRFLNLQAGGAVTVDLWVF